MKALAVILLLLPLYAPAQGPQGPSSPSPQWAFPQAPSGPDMRDPEVRRAIERQQAAHLAYQKCILDHQKEFDLYTTASQVVQVRNSRANIEAELASNPAM